jgi:hypothetical protein
MYQIRDASDQPISERPWQLSANMADQLVSPMLRSRRLSLTDMLLDSLKVRLPYTNLGPDSKMIGQNKFPV